MATQLTPNERRVARLLARNKIAEGVGPGLARRIQTKTGIHVNAEHTRGEGWMAFLESQDDQRALVAWLNAHDGGANRGRPLPGHRWGCLLCVNRTFGRTQDFAQHAHRTHGVTSWRNLLVETEI